MYEDVQYGRSRHHRITGLRSGIEIRVGIKLNKVRLSLGLDEMNGQWMDGG